MARRHGGREEHRLAAGRRLAQDPLDVLEEAQREHLVGLVQHDVARGVQRQPAAPDQVHDAARRADRDVRLALDLLGLLLDRLTAEDGDHAHAGGLAERAHGLRDLDRELARRHEHEHLDVRGVGVDVVHRRQAEGGGLAAAGLGLADQIAAPGDSRDRSALDRCGGLVPELLDGLDHGGREPKLAKGGHAGVLLCRVSTTARTRPGSWRRADAAVGVQALPRSAGRPALSE